MKFEIDNDKIYGNKIEWENIQLRKRVNLSLKESINKEIRGFDTETLNGYCKLICDSDGKYLLDGNIYDIIKFLTMEKNLKTHNFFFNLNYDVNAIIKFLPRKNLEELKEFNETDFDKYRIFFIPRKIFSISKDRNRAYKFYDVAQFFKGSLDKTSKKYLQLDKYQKSYQNIDGAILGTSKSYWKKNEKMIIEYCINDCILTRKIGELLHKTVYETIKLYPKKYMSKATLTKEYLKKSVDIPNIQNIPLGAITYAFNTYTGGRFEIIEKGNIGQCSLFDIKSAYPFYFRNLLDITKGKWKKVKSLNENADYGYYLVEVYAKYNIISPLTYYASNGTLVYPIIAYTRYMTKNELIEYEKYIDYEIIDGWEFYADEYVYPFANFIDTIFAKKNAVTDKDSFEYDLYKILMNGGYGLFMEKIRKADGLFHVGELFNPIYATEITTNTQIQVFKYAMLDIKNFVGFATDSALFKGNPDLPTGNNLGDWEKEKTGEGLVLKSGIYRIADKMQSRGMRKTENLKTPFGEYINLFEYIQMNPNLTSYPILLNNPLTFAKVIQCHKKYSQSDINVFTPESYEIDINKDIKRIWDDEFKGGFDLLQRSIKSKPIILA